MQMHNPLAKTPIESEVIFISSLNNLERDMFKILTIIKTK